MNTYKTLERVIVTIDGKRSEGLIYGRVEELTYMDPITNELVELDFDPTQEEAYWIKDFFDYNKNGKIKNLKVINKNNIKKIHKGSGSFESLMREIKSLSK